MVNADANRDWLKNAARVLYQWYPSLTDSEVVAEIRLLFQRDIVTTTFPFSDETVLATWHEYQAMGPNLFGEISRPPKPSEN